MSEIKLTEEQERAVALVCESRVSILRGGPGVGKTTVTKAIVKQLQGDGTKMIVAVAPTGRAAKRLGEALGQEASTIHRALGFRGHGFVHHRGNPLWADVLIADEMSMVDASLMAALLDALPNHAQVILVGDADQLPSVGPGMIFRDLIACGEVPVALLTQIHRQDERSQIALNCGRINRGEQAVFAAGTDSEFLDAETE